MRASGWEGTTRRSSKRSGCSRSRLRSWWSSSSWSPTCSDEGGWSRSRSQSAIRSPERLVSCSSRTLEARTLQLPLDQAQVVGSLCQASQLRLALCGVQLAVSRRHALSGGRHPALEYVPRSQRAVGLEQCLLNGHREPPCQE